MAIDSFDEFLRQLPEHPEWQERLRRVVLTDHLLALPGAFAELAQAQAGTERRLERLTARVDQLAATVDQLAGHTGRLTDRVGEMYGEFIELRYHRRATAYFSPIAKRLHVLTSDELEELLDAASQAGQLDQEQAQAVRLADVVVRGRREGEVVYLVVEASAVVRVDDANRARERAAYLARTGVTAIPVVAGPAIDLEAPSFAQEFGVWQVSDGRVTPPSAAA